MLRVITGIVLLIATILAVMYTVAFFSTEETGYAALCLGLTLLFSYLFVHTLIHSK